MGVMTKKRNHPRPEHPHGYGPIGLIRQRGLPYPCGLCGREEKLTQTHVPPRCAGNSNVVSRQSLLTRREILHRSRSERGGLHVYGLCKRCNNLQSLYDEAYCDLARSLFPCWIRGGIVTSGNRMELPSQQIAPGVVARSILIGMFGLDANLRVLYPELADSLLHKADSLRLPGDLRLLLALARGTTARVTGSILGNNVVTMFGISTMAQVYFPPMAWQLVVDYPVSLGPSLLDSQGWADVSKWLSYPPTNKYDLRKLVPSLPIVVHPTRDPQHASCWSEISSGDTTFIVECEHLPDFRS